MDVPAPGHGRPPLLERSSTRALRIGLLVAIALAVVGQILVQVTFAQVHHPVSLAEANTTADPHAVREQYRTLVDQGTYGQFRLTETVDYLWAFGVAASLVLAMLLVARTFAESSRLRTIARRLAPVAAVGGLLDAAENTVSHLMLADPWGFPDWLAPLHAGIARVKIPAIVVGVTLVITGLIVRAIIGRTNRAGGVTE